MDGTADLDRLREAAAAPLHPNANGNGSPPAVCLADLLEEVANIVNRYVQLPDPVFAMLEALWIALTYCFQCFDNCGYLALRSATPRCGKSRVLRLLSLFSNGRPPITAISTAAVLFRSPDPVLILDEVDRLRSQDKELYGDVIAVLNMGYQKEGMVRRVERGPGGFVLKSYPVFGPKALAGIEGLTDTITDRAFQIQMVRTCKRLPRLNIRKMQTRAEEIRAGFALWAEHHQTQLVDAYDNQPIDGLPALSDYDDRFQDIAEPLVVIASLADAERPYGIPVLPRLLIGLKAAAGRREPQGREREIVTFLGIVNDLMKGEEEIFIASAALLDLCQEREDLSYIETTRRLAAFLKNFELRPGFNSVKTERGYTIRRAWVAEWDARYRGCRE